MKTLESLLQLTKVGTFRKNFFRKTDKKTVYEKLGIPEEELYFYDSIDYSQWRALKDVSQPVDLVLYSLPSGIKAILPFNSGTDVVAPPFELAITPRFRRAFKPDGLDFHIGDQVAAFQLIYKSFDGFVLRYIDLENLDHLATCYDKKVSDNPAVKADVILVVDGGDDLRVKELSLKYTILRTGVSDSFLPEECQFEVEYWKGQYSVSHAHITFVKPAIDIAGQNQKTIKTAQIFGRSPFALELMYCFDSSGIPEVVYAHSRQTGPMPGSSVSSCCGDYYCKEKRIDGVFAEEGAVEETERVFVDGVGGAQRFGQRIDFVKTMQNLADVFVNPANVRFETFSPVCFEK